PFAQRSGVDLVEGAKAVLGEGFGRAQLTGAERRQRPAGAADRVGDLRKAWRERHRAMKAHAHDFEPGPGGYAAGILKARRDVAVATGRENRGAHAGIHLVASNRGTLRHGAAIDKGAPPSAHLKKIIRSIEAVPGRNG